jgi:hypothetical protein
MSAQYTVVILQIHIHCSFNCALQYTTTVSNFVVCGFVAPYSHTLTRIHILCQNSCRWLLCNSAVIGIDAGNTAERSCKTSIVTLTVSSADWNWCPHSFSFKWGKKEKLHGARSGEYEGCNKMVTCCFASSATRTEQCVGALSCSNSQLRTLTTN